MAERLMRDSGVEWIGKIPSNWHVYPARYAFSEVKSKNTNGAETNALKFYNGTIIRKPNFDADSDDYVAETITNYTIVEPNTIMINGLNLNYDLKSLRVGLVTERGIITSAYLALRPNDRILPAFANYLFKGYETKMAFHNMGEGIRKTLGFKEFKNQPILLPEKEEQAHIADFLDKKASEIDAVISKTKESIEEYKKLKQSIITEAVTKGLDPNVEMKDSGIKWIGQYPETWKLAELKMFVAVNNGKEIENEVEKTENAIDVYGSGGVFKYTDKYMYDGEAVLFGRKGTLGKPLYVNQKFWTVDTMYYLTMKEGLLSKYNYYQLIAFDWEPYITHTALPSVVASEVVSQKFPIPSKKEQEQIVDYLDGQSTKYDSLISKKEQVITELEQYKKSLIYEYVTGKKEVA